MTKAITTQMTTSLLSQLKRSSVCSPENNNIELDRCYLTIYFRNISHFSSMKDLILICSSTQHSNFSVYEINVAYLNKRPIGLNGHLSIRDSTLLVRGAHICILTGPS